MSDIQQHPQTRFVLFHAVEHPNPILMWGEPVDPKIDVGLSMANMPPSPVQVRAWNMKSPGDPDAKPTEEILTIKSLFCPIDTKRDRPGSLVGKLEESLPAEPSATGDSSDLDRVPKDDEGLHRRPQLASRSKVALTLPDTSLCPDDITFVPNIQNDEEMHFELELVVVTRAIDKTDLTPAETLSYIVGYTLAVTSSVHPLGNETSEPGPGCHSIDAWCPFGPTLVTPSMLPDPGALRVEVVVNGIECAGNFNRPCLGTVQSSIVHMAKRGFLSAGTFMMTGRDRNGFKRRGPSLRLYKGESVVFKASHGIGHLLQSTYKERAPPRLRYEEPVRQTVQDQ